MLNKNHKHIKGQIKHIPHNVMENKNLTRTFLASQIDQHTNTVYSLLVVLSIWFLAFEHVPNFVAFAAHSFGYVSIHKMTQFFEHY